jgi:hypothetical protein
MGAVEEGGKVATSLIETMRHQPLVLAMMLMNIGLLLFLAWYMSRITSRTEVTVAQLFAGQDKLFTQWGTIVKDTSDLAEKSLHCITVDDALKLIRGGTSPDKIEPTKLLPLLTPLSPLKLQSITVPVP